MALRKSKFQKKVIALAMELKELVKGRISFSDLIDLAYYLFSEEERAAKFLREIKKEEQHHPNYFTQPVDYAFRNPWKILSEENKRREGL